MKIEPDKEYKISGKSLKILKDFYYGKLGPSDKYFTDNFNIQQLPQQSESEKKNLHPGQNLYEALENICGFIAIDDEMKAIISAINKDNPDYSQQSYLTNEEIEKLYEEYFDYEYDPESKTGNVPESEFVEFAKYCIDQINKRK